MFHDVGKVTMPPDGSVSIFNYRFPCVGRVRDVSIRLLGVPLNSGITVTATANGQQIFEAAWEDGRPLLKLPDNMPVDEYTFLSVRLSRTGGEENLLLSADIAYIFQEHGRAKVQSPV